MRCRYRWRNVDERYMGANSLADTGKKVQKIDAKGITIERERQREREKRTGYRYTADWWPPRQDRAPMKTMRR